MIDIFLDWGGDLTVGSGGDLALTNDTTTINQRICRRLLTNPGDYLWNLDYGGGLGQFIGLPVSSTDIEAIVTTQISLEAAIPSTPAPQVRAQVTNAADGYVSANITYADPSSTQAMTIDIVASQAT